MRSPDYYNVSQVVRNCKPIAAGVECAYLYDGDMWGVKLFENQEDADRVYTRQKELFDLDLAPEPHLKVSAYDFGDKFGFSRYVYGFPVHHVDIVRDHLKRARMEWWAHNEWKQLFADFVEVLAKETDYQYLTDFHASNFAWVGDMIQLVDMGCLVLDKSEDEEIDEWDHVDLKESLAAGYPVLVNCNSPWPHSSWRNLNA